MKSDFSEQAKEKYLKPFKNKDKTHKSIKSDLTPNRIRENNKIKSKYDIKKVSKNQKKINLRNKNQEQFSSNTQSDKFEKYETKRMNNSMIYLRSNDKKIKYPQNIKKNYLRNKNDIKTQYSLYQQELKSLMDKEEKIKLLKNQLKLQNMSTFEFYKNNISGLSNTNIKPKNKKYNIATSHSPDYNKKARKVKSVKKNYSMINEKNYEKNLFTNSNLLNNSDSYRHNLHNYSNDKVNTKKKPINKQMIQNIKKKKKMNVSLFPFYNIDGNISTERNIDTSNLNSFNLSFKKQKKKNLINLKNPNKPLYTFLNRNDSMSKNKSGNSKKTGNFKSGKRIKSSNKNYSMTKNNKSKTYYKTFEKKYKKLSNNKSNNKNGDKSKKKKKTNTHINEIEIKKDIKKEKEEKKEEKKGEEKENQKEKEKLSENIDKVEDKLISIDKIGIITKAGEDNPGEEKINQDNYFDSDLCNGYKFIGVCDGHGEDGQNVSEYLRDNLPEEVNLELEKLISSENTRLNILESMLHRNRNESENNNNEKERQEKIIKNFQDIEKINDLFKRTFVSINLRLIEENYMLNLETSGSTCSSIFLQKDKINKLYSVNVGDSRSIIIRESSKDNGAIWSFEALSRDHKPSDKDEADRIIQHGGEIQQIQNENGEWEGPFRIFMKNEEGPGLAMSRSFGDIVGTMLGIICEPEIKEFTLTKEDKAIIIASDGLWEYVQNEEVTNIVKNLYDKNDPDLIVNELYKFSHERWKEKDCGIDDITIICVLLK